VKRAPVGFRVEVRDAGFATQSANRGLSTSPPDGACWHKHLAASFFVFLNSLIQNDLRSKSSPPRGLAASWLGGELAVAGGADRNCIATPETPTRAAQPISTPPDLHYAIGSVTRTASASSSGPCVKPISRIRFSMASFSRRTVPTSWTAPFCFAASTSRLIRW